MKNAFDREASHGFGFGQPYGSVVQAGYVVSNIVSTMTHYARDLGIGPWFFAEDYRFVDATYRGEPSEVAIRVGIAFSGGMSYELIEQVNDVPSIYKSGNNPRTTRFHHWGIGSKDFDADLARQVANGHEVHFTATSPRGIRLAYLDTRGALPGMIEVIEFSELQEAVYTAIYDESTNWDKKHMPIRPFNSLKIDAPGASRDQS